MAVLMLLVVLAGVLGMLVVGVLLVVKSRSGALGYPACGKCRYDLRQTVGTASRCPECGAEFVEVGILPPAGQRNRLMLWGGIVLIAFPFTCAGFAVLSTLGVRQSVTTARSAAMAAQQRAMAAQTQAAAAATSPDGGASPAAPATAPDVP